MRNGLRIVDTDCHQIEPASMWKEYIEPAFADRAPRAGDLGGRRGMMVEGDSGSPYWPSYGDRMVTHTAGHILAHPFEAMSAMMCLIWFGVIERHPRLRVVHVEADAGWVPYWLQRMEQHWEFSGNAEHPELEKPPTEYFLSNFLVVARGDERTLPAAISLAGDRSFAVNTDYPHPDGTWPWGIERLVANEEIPQASRRRILWDNAAEVFGLDA